MMQGVANSIFDSSHAVKDVRIDASFSLRSSHYDVRKSEDQDVSIRSDCKAVFWKRSIIGLLRLPRFGFRFHQNAVILLVAIPPTNLEAADTANRFRFRFQNPAAKPDSLFNTIVENP